MGYPSIRVARSAFAAVLRQVPVLFLLAALVIAVRGCSTQELFIFERIRDTSSFLSESSARVWWASAGVGIVLVSWEANPPSPRVRARWNADRPERKSFYYVTATAFGDRRDVLYAVDVGHNAASLAPMYVALRNQSLPRGFAFAAESNTSSIAGETASGITVAVPHWLVISLASVIPAIRVGRLVERHLARRYRLCPNCAYDLAVTVDRCPECGASVSEPQ